MKRAMQKITALSMATAIAGICLIQTTFQNQPEIQTDLLTQAVAQIPLLQAPGADNGMTTRSGTATVSGATVNVRSGPSTAYSVIGTVKKGTKLVLHGSFTNGWFKISYGNGYGYITGQYLINVSYNNSGLIAYAATAVTTDSLIVRAGNGTGYKKLGVLAKGAAVTITGKYSNGWYQIKYNGGSGCVSGSYLKDIKTVGQTTTQKPPSTTNPPATTATTKPTTTQSQSFSKIDATAVTTDALNVRTGNGTSYSKLGVLAKGASVTITGKYSNGWYEIKYNNGKGCVSGDYLKNIKIITPPSTTNPSSTTTTTKPTTTTTTVVQPPSEPGMTVFYAKGITTDNLNVRPDPSTKNTKLGTLAQGTAVGIIGKFEKTGWYKIVYRSGYGYVSGDYVKNIVQVDASGLYLNQSSLSLKQGTSQTLALYSLFSQGKLTSVIWESNNPKVAKVSTDGVVTGVSGGTAVITATNKTSGKKVTCAVTVLNYKASARISGVPNYNQLTSGYPTGCEQFSARMLVNYYGYNASAQDIVNAITLSPAPYTKNGKTYGGDPSISFVGDPKKKKPYGYGCLPSAIVGGINRYMDKVGGAYRAKDISGCDMETIYSYISQGIPVIAGSAYLPSVNNPVKEPAWTWIIDSGANKGKSVTWWRNRHVMVIVGYDENYIYVNDPCFDNMQKFNKADWIADWNRVDRHTLVMLKK